MKKLVNKIDAKQVVLPHSQAKLDLYRNYLRHYIRILSHASFCTQINLYDIFCGVGLYEDGNEGSPLITNSCIKEIIGEMTISGKPLKPIHVSINDKEKTKVDNVKSILSGQEIPGCKYKYYNLVADKMLDIVTKEIESSASTERNLVFIDPYGYSDIVKEKLYNLLKKETTEIILFLPINQMYRFSEIALVDSQRTCYENLRQFIISFFPLGHQIHTSGIRSNIEFVYEIKQALTFNNKFLTCSHYIERGKGNYYGLFFITSNIYGLEKLIEAKWDVDPVKGKGFNQKNTQAGLFDQEFEETDRKQHLDYLKTCVIDFLRANPVITNPELYKLALMNEFKTSHMNSAIKDLLNGKRLVAIDKQKNQTSPPLAYYINYDHYKRQDIKVTFKLVK